MQTLTLNTGTLSRDRLAVVQNVDPQIVEIVLTTPHVAVYVFQQGLNQWDRKNIEGPLYLVRRAARPEFSLLILNRKGPNHMCELITEHHEFNNQDPYIIFRNAQASQPLPPGRVGGRIVFAPIVFAPIEANRSECREAALNGWERHQLLFKEIVFASVGT